LVAVGFASWWGLGRRRVFEALLVLGVPAASVIAFVAPEPRQLGLRYMLPVLALALATAAPLVRFLAGAASRRRTAVAAGLAVVGVAQLFWLWEAAPHSLAWTAPPFRPGYQVATDSNLDWGQDLYALARFARHKDIAVMYFGTVDPALVVHRAKPVGTQPPTGWLAVSASYLTAWRGAELSWLRAYCPVRAINDTILVYRFDREPDRRPGPARPAAVCARSTSRRR
jgi:hypothetical protein